MVPPSSFACIENSGFGDLGFCASAVVTAFTLTVAGQSGVGLLVAVTALTLMTYAPPSLTRIGFAVMSASASCVSLSFSFLNTCGCRAVYRGEGLFKNLGFLLDTGGAKEEVGFTLIS